MTDAHEFLERKKKGKNVCPVCGWLLVSPAFGSGETEDKCSNSDCKPVDHIADASKMVPPVKSFVEPKELDPDEPRREGYREAGEMPDE